ncbi:MAG: DoxX family protein [Terriglobia bacterium]
MGEKLEALKPLSLLLLRVVMGAAFMAHGYPKLFEPSERHFQFFATLGFPAWAVSVAGLVEFFGGLLLIAGLFTRVAAFFLSGEMAVVFLRAHLPAALEKGGLLGFLGRSRDEYPLLLCVASFLLLTLGAGALSLDAVLFRKKKD